jgi:hypothetical protein
MFMLRVFFFSLVLSIFSAILLSVVLRGLLDRIGYIAAIPVADAVGCLIVILVVIYIVAKRRLWIGRSRRSLLKYQDVLDSAILFPGTILFWTALALGEKVIFGGPPSRSGIPIFYLGLYVFTLYGLRFVLRRALFSSEERAEIDAKSKARRAVLRAAQRGAKRSVLGSLTGPGWRL